MANTILSATTAREYRLPNADRQAILAGADNPHGKISRARLSVIERQRIFFVEKYGNEFGHETA